MYYNICLHISLNAYEKELAQVLIIWLWKKKKTGQRNIPLNLTPAEIRHLFSRNAVLLYLSQLNFVILTCGQQNK